VKLFKNIAIVFVAVLMIDGCIYRDPGVTLHGGYEIVAISPSSPCALQYVSWHDHRTYSDYSALVGTDPATNKPTFSLVSDSEVLDFNDKSDWLAAIQKHRAVPDESSLQLEDIESFAADSKHIVGTYDQGHFIVDIQANTLDTFSDEHKWASSVSHSTALSPKFTRLSPGWHVLRHGGAT